MKKLTIEEMRSIAEERGGKCLSDVYVHSHRKLLWECAEGHQWEATPHNNNPSSDGYAFHKFIGGQVMKVMNILILSLVIIVGNLFWINEKISAQMLVDGGDVVIMDITKFTRDGTNQTEEILVYHKASKAFLLYGYSSTIGKGLQLLQIRRLDNDFGLAEALGKRIPEEQELKYNRKGYNLTNVYIKLNSIK